MIPANALKSTYLQLKLSRKSFHFTIPLQCWVQCLRSLAEFLPSKASCPTFFLPWPKRNVVMCFCHPPKIQIQVVIVCSFDVYRVSQSVIVMQVKYICKASYVLRPPVHLHQTRSNWTRGVNKLLTWKFWMFFQIFELWTLDKPADMVPLGGVCRLFKWRCRFSCGWATTWPDHSLGLCYFSSWHCWACRAVAPTPAGPAMEFVSLGLAHAQYAYLLLLI